jgi:glycosyltransferase involved in cell wall biosynthesis
MRIAILARGVGRPGGVGRILDGLLSSLPAEAPEDEFLAFTDAPLPDRFARANLRGITLPAANAAVFDHHHVARAAADVKPDVFLATKNTVPAGLPCPAACIFLDLAYFAMPEAYPFVDRVYMRAMFRRSAAKAATIIAISEHTRDDVKRFLGDDAFLKTRVIYPGTAETFRVMNEGERVEARGSLSELPERFVLYAGNISPRKNLPRLLEAFEKVEARTALVLTGHRSWKARGFERALDAARKTRDVRVLGALDDEALAGLYNLATASVYPSMYEGFGFPVLEAFACGTPVAASSATSIPEVTGYAAALFDPFDTADIARAVQAVLSDESMRARMSEKGLARAREFTWRRAAREVLAALRETA